jgi:uncharacterized membrane protein YkvA (DUF1232 family)
VRGALRRRLGGRSRRRARTVATGLIPLLPQVLRLLGGLLVDGRVSVVNRLLAVAAGLYILMPFDLLPDFLGVLGWSDDLFLAGLVIRRLVVGAGEEVVRSHWTGSVESLRRLRTGLDDLGTLVPGPVRRVLESFAGAA